MKFIGALERAGNIREGDLTFVNVRRFGAVGDGIADDTDAILRAVSSVVPGGEVRVPIGIYRVTDTIHLNGRSLVGVDPAVSGHMVESPTGGTIIKGEVGQNKAVLTQVGTSTSLRGWRIENLSIDMSGCADGGSSSHTNTAEMTKGIFVKNSHNFYVKRVFIHQVPTNGAGICVWGGNHGVYWGNWTHVYVNFKKASGDDISAKGFVFNGTRDDLVTPGYCTEQHFHQSVSYRGFYSNDCTTFTFLGGGFENSPGNGMLDSGSKKFVFIGGFYEQQAREDLANVDSYNLFRGTNGSKQFTFIGVSMSGNGPQGIENIVRLTDDGRVKNSEKAVQLSGLSVDSDGTVGLNRTAAIGYASNFNSTVPPTTEHAIYFSTSIGGFDRLGEYNSGNGLFSFLLPSPLISVANERVYRVSVNL